jgi:hypothetical protein
MAKRFTDTNKYKKPFIRGLQGAYKLFWDYLYHDCDHAGIWIVDIQIAQMYLGSDMKITKEKALLNFNSDEVRIVEIDNGKKWFIPSFITFQYGQLSENNRAHTTIISILKKLNLLNQDLSINLNKPLISPLQGDKEMEKEMEKEMDMEMVKEKGTKRKNIFSDCFTDWFLAENETPFKMQTKDFVAISSIEKYCIENKKEGFEPIALFKFVLEKYSTLPDWYLNNKNPTFINSKFPEIIALLRQKTIKTDNLKGKQEKNNDVFSNILNEINSSENGTQNGYQRSLS